MAVQKRDREKIAAVLNSRRGRGNICLVKDILARYGDKWSLYTILLLGRDGALRFTEIRTGISGISQRMLTVTLRALLEDGIITRTEYAETPPRVEYALSSLGESLLKELVRLATWSAEHFEEIKKARKAFKK